VVSVSLRLLQFSCFTHGAHNLPILRGPHPVKTLFSRLIFLIAIEPGKKTLRIALIARLGFGFGVHVCASVCTQSETALPHSQVLRSEGNGPPHGIQCSGRRLRGPRDYGFLIASRRIAGYPANEPSPSPRTDNLWGFPEQPSSPSTPSNKATCAALLSLNAIPSAGKQSEVTARFLLLCAVGLRKARSRYSYSLSKTPKRREGRQTMG